MATISKQNTVSFASIGIDIGKEVFHLVGFDPDGKITGARNRCDHAPATTCI